MAVGQGLACKARFQSGTKLREDLEKEAEAGGWGWGGLLEPIGQNLQEVH